MYTSLPDRSISTGTFLIYFNFIYLCTYLCVHLFSATQRSFHALQPQRSISLLFFVFCFVVVVVVVVFFLPERIKVLQPRLPRRTGLFPTQSSLSLFFFVSEKMKTCCIRDLPHRLSATQVLSPHRTIS